MMTLKEALNIVTNNKKNGTGISLYSSLTLDYDHIRDTILNSSIYTYIDSIEHYNNIEYNINKNTKETYNNIIRPHIKSIIMKNNNSSTIIARPNIITYESGTSYTIDIYNMNELLIRYYIDTNTNNIPIEYGLTNIDNNKEYQNINIINHLDTINSILSK